MTKNLIIITLSVLVGFILAIQFNKTQKSMREARISSFTSSLEYCLNQNPQIIDESIRSRFDEIGYYWLDKRETISLTSELTNVCDIDTMKNFQIDFNYLIKYNKSNDVKYSIHIVKKPR